MRHFLPVFRNCDPLSETTVKTRSSLRHSTDADTASSLIQPEHRLPGLKRLYLRMETYWLAANSNSSNCTRHGDWRCTEPGKSFGFAVMPGLGNRLSSRSS